MYPLFDRGDVGVGVAGVFVDFLEKRQRQAILRRLLICWRWVDSVAAISMRSGYTAIFPDRLVSSNGWWPIVRRWPSSSSTMSQIQ
ncbi:hypothetical protein BST32_20080 [Mycobacteroides abscessus subsp. massiliense]|nr:hypothetical protein MMAS_03810 [Mycobacteroides abscessus subsp. massiliense CCUG 48898 = JCM 15300]EIV69304.1 hypothetical protein MMCCUG48898_0244 [Mycobacteroides abscessus subsp. massiliense CCUG 48898 = JCM 15300]ORA87644.1 hypothetical protein BST32_20080 [Mycobacteroides abscessus subsp. massiliense]BAP95226.1 hypothetical protein MMASJCM_0450 [Mycobacteroides abscessus subsp. massiliense CCUG 48898 = JCM 15300]